MRIAVFGGFAPSLLNFRAPMMRAMVEAGHQVIGLAPEQDAHVEAQLAAMGIGYQPVPLSRTGMNPARDYASIRALTQVFKTLKPDLLLSYTIKPVIFGSVAAARAGVPNRFAMITGLGSGLQGTGFRSRLLALLIRRLYHWGLAANQGIIFQNPDDESFFLNHGLLPSNCAITRINGSGVDLDHFTQVHLPKGPLTFLMVARLVQDKGLWEFVQAARLLKSSHPEANCQLLGPFDTNPTAVSREVVAGWESEGIIQYLGETQDVRPFLSNAHVAVLPSYGEGTPRSVLEAMAMGRAVVTTQAPGCKETVVEGQTGLLVPPRDAGALAEAMGRLAGDFPLIEQMGAAGRRYAEQRYDVHAVNRDILAALGLGQSM